MSGRGGFEKVGGQAFRERHGLADKYVVMYAGNHSPCHPLETLLAAARELANHEQIAFCFVGGGSEQDKVRQFAKSQGLKNIQCLPYQPFNELSALLSAADLQVVVMGEEFVGIVHPCKVYNLLAVGIPILYIGPEASHVTDIVTLQGDRNSIFVAPHGAATVVAKHIVDSVSAKAAPDIVVTNAGQFSRDDLMPVMINVLESAGSATVRPAAISQTSISSGIKVDSRP